MKPFTDHPASVGETYFQHMRCSFSFGWRMFIAAGACFIHGVFPFLCTKRGSQAITELHDCMVVNRNRLAQRDCIEAETAAGVELTPAE